MADLQKHIDRLNAARARLVEVRGAPAEVQADAIDELFAVRSDVLEDSGHFSAPHFVMEERDLLRARLAEVKAQRDEAIRRPAFDLVAHLHRQRAFSERTFGPGTRAAGVVDHIRKELVEIERDPADLVEWIDVVLLACDGAWRQGYEPEQIAQALAAKLAKNEARAWPDWRTADPNKAIEHKRDGEPPISDSQPVGDCPRCGAPVYTAEGFCGGCAPGAR